MRELEYNYNILDILEEDNVANLLDEKDLESIGMEVVDGYNIDKDSRSEWEERNNKSLDLALQVVEPKNTPWPNAANVKYPLLSTAALQFAARAYPALIPGPNVVKGRIIGYDSDGSKTQKAIRISKHMSYQVFEEMEDWEEHMDKLCMTLPILGTVFKKTYYDPISRKNRSEVVYPMDLVVDYYARALEDTFRVTHVFSLSDNDIYERVAANMYLDVDIDMDDSSQDSVQDHDREAKERQGLEEPEEGENEARTGLVLEQHTFFDLDGDGYAEPYIATVHIESKKVLRIVRRFDYNDMEMDNGRVLKINPVHYFTKFSFIPSPDGSFYDIGFGTLLGPINNTINSTLNMLLDAGALSNMGGGFISKGIRLKGGKVELGPGEWVNVNTTGDDLRKGIFPAPIREPSTVLFSLLETMVSAGERLSSVTEIMTGDIPGQNTKAHVALAAIEQGMKVFNAIYKRVHRSLKKEFRKLYALNAKYLPDIAYFQVLDADMAAPISKGDYALGDIDVIPYSDPNVATETQKVSKLEALQPLLGAGLVDPMEYTRRFLEATEQPNPDALIAQPKGPDPEIQLKQMEQERKQFEAQTKAQLEAAKVQIQDKLAEAKVSKDEIDSIVAMMNVSIDADKAKREVEQSKQKATNDK